MQPIKDPYLFEKKIIQGIPVYYNNLPWSPCIHIRIGFNVGSLEDPEGKEGLAHYLEHVVLNGSPLMPTLQKVREFKKKYTLDTLNAHTGFWYTEYVAKNLPEHFNETAKGLIDLAFNPLIDEKQTTREKGIILQEMWDRYRNKKLLNYRKEYIKNTRPGLPTNRMWSPGGWPETIQNVDAEDLKKWHKKHYQKGNAYIFLVGAVEEKHLMELENILVNLPEGHALESTPKNISVQKPLINEITYNSKDIGMEKDNAELSIEINTPRNLKNEEVLVVAGDFLYTLLFEILREELGLCYNVNVSCEITKNYIENGINLGLSEDKVETAKEKIFEIIEAIGSGSYKEKFEEEKRISIDQLKASERTANSIINSASYRLLFWNEITPLTKIISDRKAVTFEETAKYIADTFKRENVYIETILP